MMRRIDYAKHLMSVTIMAVFFIAFAITGMAYSAEKEDGVYYTCPMASHSDVARAEPGKCPKCGMTLVKKEIGDTKFVCPMKGHEDVVSDKPGKCPKCGMWLVPKKSDDVAGAKNNMSQMGHGDHH